MMREYHVRFCIVVFGGIRKLTLTLLSLRYLIIQKFWAGCVSVLGIVCGEIIFMLFLILPPPFIQISLVYLESVWPYIIGLSLIIFIIFDLISNPYTNTMSLSQNNNQISPNLGPSPLTKQIPARANFTGTNWTQFLPIKLGNNTTKIFGFSFLLALTEQSCYFSFFGSLNLSSTANFLDTYLFAASRSPIILFFSCIGFLLGSFLAINIYNFILAKMIFIVASLAIKIKQYNPNFIRNWTFNRQTNLTTSMNLSKDSRNDSIPKAKFVLVRIYLRIKNNIISSSSYLFAFLKGSAGKLFSFKSLLLTLKNFLQRFIMYLPGGKRIVFFLFPGQAHSYKSDFQTTSRSFGLRNESSKNSPQGQIYPPAGANQIPGSSFSSNWKSEPKNAFFSIENTIENLLRTDSSPHGQGTERSSSMGSSKNSPQGRSTSQSSALQLGGSTFYNKIDKVLLTCLITLSFTTIPYYSFDYLINSFFGFIPQDQILNANSLRVNFPDYTNLLGITLSDNNSVINTDVSLYDRAHFMYGEWPNSFESLNYQGELMWTNLRDHRRQKRTRRSTRLKFKTLKTKISTSWKEFKRSSGFSGSTGPPSFSEETQWDSNFSRDSRLNLKTNNKKDYENPRRDELQNLSEKLTSKSLQKNDASTSNLHINENGDPNQNFNNRVYEKNRSQTQRYLRNTNNLSNLFYKIFLASPLKAFNEETSIVSNRFENKERPRRETEEFSSIKKNNSNQDQSNYFAPTGKNEIMPKIPEEIRRSTSLSETIKPLSTSTFIDLSGGEKYIKTYPKNWKRVITEKYYQNPIYKTVLSNDLKNFLKREPLTQQLTNNQENELYFLRVKMAHYYDSLRFYFTLKENINSTRSKADYTEGTSGILKSSSEKNFPPERIWKENKTPSKSSISPDGKSEPIISLSGLKNQTRDASVFSQRENTDAGVEESLKTPPFQFKSMTSMNYRQQFKGTLKTVKQLFAISLPESVSASSNAQYEQKSAYPVGSDFAYKDSNQPINAGLTGGTEPIEKSYKYDKYLFNEYTYPKNEFLHEEGRGFVHRKSRQGVSNLRDSYSQNSNHEKRKGSTFSNEGVGSRSYRGIGLTTKNIYNMFGSNDPFYVGWDKNLRKFVLTSRILSRSKALNYDATNLEFNAAQNKKQKSSQGRDFNNDNSIRHFDPSDLSKQKNRNNKQELDTSSSVPIYSTKDINRLKSTLAGEKNPAGVDFNQQSVHLYRPYTSWPFLKHQLKNLPNRPYFVLYENYLNILNKRIHLFRNININDIDTKSLTFLYSYSFNNNVKKYVSQLPINIYKQSMRPSSLENLFTPTSNARSSFLWPGGVMPAWEYYFW